MQRLFLVIVVFAACACTAFGQDIDRYITSSIPKTYRLDITSQWTATTFTVALGETLAIVANGIASTEGANTAPRQFNWIGPEGSGNAIAAAWYPMPNVPEQCVIGKIGSTGTPFYIGRGLAFKATKAGTLYLGYNDIDFTQNYGYYIVHVFAKLPH